jgi:DNA-directed RNA polymerase subunit RPC12/RpoP
VPTSIESQYLKSGKAVFGGFDFRELRATYRCDDCGKSWLLPDDLVEQIAPTEKQATCHFCGEALRSDERLRYELDAEEYKESVFTRLRNEVPARTFLQPETFASRPYPICDTCRNEVHENARDIERKDRKHKIIVRVVCATFGIFFLTLWIVSHIFRK